jgi:hypothetical protein
MQSFSHSSRSGNKAWAQSVFCLAAAALGLAAYGWSQTPDGKDRNGMIKIPVSSKMFAAQWPRPGVDEYTFSVRSFGGQMLGVDLREFDWTLEVDSRHALVSVELFRSDADIPGTPIGLFRYSIDDAALRDFEALAIAAKLDEVHPAMKGHPGYTERLYTFTRGSRKIQLSINNSDEQTNASIAPFRTKINTMLSASFKHPERAVKLGLKRQATGFEVSVENVGIEKVCFTDPRWLASTGVLHRSAVLVTEFPESKPGDAPPMFNWQPVPLEPMAHYPEKEQLVTLESHGVWTATVPWTRPAAKRHLAYFTWANFQGQPTVDQVYRIRGRADSPRLVIEP